MLRRLLILWWLALAVPAFAEKEGAKLDPVPRIAIMSAFAPELTALHASVADPHEWNESGVRFTTGTIGGKPVLLFLSGESLVNAARATQLAIDRFTVRRIVFSGIAGGVDPGLSIGDVVVAERWGQYLESVFARRDGEGFAPPPGSAGRAPFPNYGMIYPRGVQVASGEGYPQRRFWFDADPAMLAVARQVAESAKLARCIAALCLAGQPKVVVGGGGISGPVFMDNADFRVYAFQTFGARCLDMETAAVAQVAYLNHVPYVAFRSLSDLAGGDAGHNQARTFFQIASDNSAAVVKAFVAAWRD